MRSNKFFTLKQLEELDKLGPTAYFYVNPGTKEIVEILSEVEIAEEFEELTDSDIIHEEEQETADRPCSSQVLSTNPRQLGAELSQEHRDDNGLLHGLFELSSPF